MNVTFPSFAIWASLHCRRFLWPISVNLLQFQDSVEFQATPNLENQNRRTDYLDISDTRPEAWACVCARSRRAGCVYHIINVSRAERSLRGWVWAAGLWLVQARGARVLIGRLETLGCLPRRSNEKPWPPPVSKVAKPYCNCTLSNGVSHASAPASVMTITIMLLRSLRASPSRFQLLREIWNIDVPDDNTYVSLCVFK